MEFFVFLLLFVQIAKGGELPPVERFYEVFGDDPYKIFDLNPSEDVTSQEVQRKIKKRYRELSLEYHPDKNGNPHIAHLVFLSITDALAKLKHSPESRPNKREREQDFDDAIRRAKSDPSYVKFGENLDLFSKALKNHLKKRPPIKFPDKLKMAWVYYHFPKISFFTAATTTIGATLGFFQNEQSLPWLILFGLGYKALRDSSEYFIFDFERNYTLKGYFIKASKIRSSVIDKELDESGLSASLSEIEIVFDRIFGPIQSLSDLHFRTRLGVKLLSSFVRGGDIEYNLKLYSLFLVYFHYYLKKYNFSDSAYSLIWAFKEVFISSGKSYENGAMKVIIDKCSEILEGRGPR